MVGLAVFRCDGGPRMGGGHVARCLSLAGELVARGWRCAFAVSAETAATMAALEIAGHPITVLPGADEAAALATAYPQGCDLLVIDHYGRDAAYEAACRPWAERIAVIDDLADRRHDCDILLDPTLGRAAEDYRPLVPAGCTLLLGPAYALLKPDFATARVASLKRRKTKPRLGRLLISFGGTDPLGATDACLAALKRANAPFAIDIVLGAAAANIESVRRHVEQMPRARLHVETQAMAALMAEADCALGGTGATAWERCCLGLPAVCAALVDNQRTIARRLAEAGAVRSIGDWRAGAPDELIKIVMSLTADDLAGLSGRAANICDGSGIFKVADALHPLRRSHD